MLHDSTEGLADNTLPCAVLTSGEIDLDASPHEEQPLSRLCYEQDLYSGCSAPGSLVQRHRMPDSLQEHVSQLVLQPHWGYWTIFCVGNPRAQQSTPITIAQSRSQSMRTCVLARSRGDSSRCKYGSEAGGLPGTRFGSVSVCVVTASPHPFNVQGMDRIGQPRV